MFPRQLTLLRLVEHLALAAACSCTPPKPVHPSEWPDDHWAEIARRVPGFAGWWPNAGTIVLMLADTTQRDAALEALTAELPRGYTIRVRPASFDFIKLRNWKHQAISDSGVIFSDADEVLNRVVVGVRDSASIIPTRKRLLAMGIPPEALMIEVSGPFKW